MKKIIFSILILISFVAAQVVYVGNQYQDALSRCQVTLSQTHNHIHQGDAWYTSIYFGSVADDGVARVLLIAPAGYEDHVVAVATFGGLGSVRVLEAPLYTNTGTLVSTYNYKRRWTGTNTTLIYSSPLGITNLGTVLPTFYLPAGDKTSGIGGTIRMDDELITYPGKAYIIEYSNFSGGAVAGSIGLDFYEETIW